MPANRLNQTERSIVGRIGAHKSWGQTEDRTARTANARKALEDKFLAEADGDPVRAEHLRRAYSARLAFKSAQARRRPAGLKEVAASAATPSPQSGSGVSTPPTREAVVAERIAALDGGAA
jgi:hypothetical protein